MNTSMGRLFAGALALLLPLATLAAQPRPVADPVARATALLDHLTDTDWRLWQAALADRPRATLRRYPALNHLGIAGEGPGTIAEYQQPGHVDARLIAHIAAWLHATTH